MRIKTLTQIVKSVKQEDPDSAINKNMLLTMISENMIPYDMHGNRLVADYDEVLFYLRNRLEVGTFFGVPHLRSIEKAYKYTKEHNTELGLSEENLRQLVKLGKLPHLRIGNRCYIALETLKQPMKRHLTFKKEQTVYKKPPKQRDAMLQIGDIIQHSQSTKDRYVLTRKRENKAKSS